MHVSLFFGRHVEILKRRSDELILEALVRIVHLTPYTQTPDFTLNDIPPIAPGQGILDVSPNEANTNLISLVAGTKIPL